MLFLFSDAARFINGALIDINGGRFLRQPASSLGPLHLHCQILREVWNWQEQVAATGLDRLTPDDFTLKRLACWNEEVIS